jgi:hypothetical protein
MTDRLPSPQDILVPHPDYEGFGSDGQFMKRLCSKMAVVPNGHGEAPCILYKGSASNDARIRWADLRIPARRFVYELCIGYLPTGGKEAIGQTCKLNGICLQPKHLAKRSEQGGAGGWKTVENTIKRKKKRKRILQPADSESDTPSFAGIISETESSYFSDFEEPRRKSASDASAYSSGYGSCLSPSRSSSGSDWPP